MDTGHTIYSRLPAKMAVIIPVPIFAFGYPHSTLTWLGHMTCFGQQDNNSKHDTSRDSERTSFLCYF